MVLLHEPLGNKKITMTTLIERSGLNERQVRRCIAEGLVEGATGKGQAAHYSEKTLHRLQAIKKLMAQKVKPLDRAPTLTEIKNILEELNESQLDEIRAGAPFSFFDTGDPEQATVVDSRLDHEYLALQEKASQRQDIIEALDEARPDLAQFRSQAQSPSRSELERLQSRVQSRSSRGNLGTTFYHGELGDLGMLLEMLHDKLKTLVDDKYEPDPTEENTWVRIRTRSSIMEIHVKAPESQVEKARLKALHRAVETLIERGHGPLYD